MHPEIKAAGDNLVAKRKIHAILRSKETNDTTVQKGDLVQVFVKLGNEKRRKWLSSHNVLSVANTARISQYTEHVEETSLLQKMTSEWPLQMTDSQAVIESSNELTNLEDDDEEVIHSVIGVPEREDLIAILSDEPSLPPLPSNILHVYWPLTTTYIQAQYQKL